MAPHGIAGLVLALCVAVAADSGSLRQYSKIPENSTKLPCEDRTIDDDCTLLADIGICNDPMGVYACPMTCNLCYENFCFDSPCQNNGSCSYMEGLIGQVPRDYTCHCTVAFEGKNCTEQVDMCGKYSPCKNGATCSNVFGGYTCTCSSLLYAGVNCSETVDVCGQDKDKCKNGGSCTNNANQTDGFVCSCAGFYTGKTCEMTVDVCGQDKDKCKNGGSCTNDANQADGFVCSCAGFYTGKTCEKPEDVCGQDGKCENGGTCVNSPASTNGFTCQCSADFTGQTCGQQVDPCSPNPCANNATCRKNGTNGFVCDCGLAFTGHLCEKEKQACERFPFSPCQNQGTCINDGDTYRCTCPQGYTGSRCESKVSVCDTHPCQHGGLCIANGDNYTCMCTDKYKGDNCEEIRGLCDTLPFSPCKNGGTCVNTANGLFVCQCPPDTSGTTCSEVTTTPQTTPTTTTATTTADPCLSLVCQHGGSCVVTGGRAKCACVGDYTGDHCEGDPCTFAFCQNSAPCLVSSEGKAQCQCPGGFSGPRCQHSLCDSSPCHNGGSCHVNNGAVTCHCPGNFTGQHCETRVPGFGFVKISELGCGGKQDLAILVSAGWRTTKDDMPHDLKFVENLIKDKRMHLGPDQTKVAISTYNSDTHPRLQFMTDASKAMEDGHRMSAGWGNAILAAALDTARQALLDPLTGARPDARKVVLVILEELDDFEDDVKAAALRLRDAGISLNVVTVFWYHSGQGRRDVQSSLSERFLLLDGISKLTQDFLKSWEDTVLQKMKREVPHIVEPFGALQDHWHHFSSVHDLEDKHNLDIFESGQRCYDFPV